MFLLSMRHIFASMLVASRIFSVASAEVSIPSDIQKRPNFIVIQPDDHLFLEEWNPPGRFQTVENRASIGTFTISPSSSASESASAAIPSTYVTPVPNINRIKNNGLEMTNAYAASTMCGTSRYSTLTGRLPSRSSYGRHIDKDEIERSVLLGDEASFLRDVIIPKTKLEDVTGVQDAKDCTSNNLAAVLQQNGYATGVVGKWHLEAGTTMSGESLYQNYPQVQKDVRRCGFDFAEAIYRENLGGNHNYNVNGDPVTHNMEHITSEAIRFIHEAVGASPKQEAASSDVTNNVSKPFFLYFNPTVPHSSGDVTDALKNANCKDTVQGKLSDAPFVPYGMTANVDVEGNAGCRKYRQTVLERASKAARSIGISHDDDDKLAGAVWVDDAIGSLFETLEALDILDNTLILFQLDHGMDAKGSLFEGGSRIVQFVHYPDRIKVGGRKDPIQEEEKQGWEYGGLVSTIDIAPTLMDLAGVPSSSTNNGVGQNDKKEDEGNPSRHRYDMDGKSWFSDVVAVNTDSGKDTNIFENTQPLKSNRSKKLDHYFEERCLFVEEGMDRSVRCGCYKYIYISDVTRGFTVHAAHEQGINLKTHNFYNLCDKSTGNYINSPEMSPELWSDTFYVSNTTGFETDDDDVKKKLKEKISCLLKQTDPSKKHPDYETDCGIPLYTKKHGESLIIENDDASSNVDTALVESLATHSPTNISTSTDIAVVDIDLDESAPGSNYSEHGIYLGTKRPTPMDITDDDVSESEPQVNDGVAQILEPDKQVKDRVAPYIRSPESQSTTPLLSDTVPMYGLIVAAIVMLVVPCILYWAYREYLRKVVVRAKANRSRWNAMEEDCDTDLSDDSMKEIEKELVEAAMTTMSADAADLEVGSVSIEKAGFRAVKDFAPLIARSYEPSIWHKLAYEAKRQAFLRDKWKIYTVSGVVLGTSGNTAETDLKSTMNESASSGTPPESDHQICDKDEERDQATSLEEVEKLNDRIPSLRDNSANSTPKEETSAVEIANSDKSSDGGTDEDRKTEDKKNEEDGEGNGNDNVVANDESIVEA